MSGLYAHGSMFRKTVLIRRLALHIEYMLTCGRRCMKHRASVWDVEEVVVLSHLAFSSIFSPSPFLYSTAVGSVAASSVSSSKVAASEGA